MSRRPGRAIRPGSAVAGLFLALAACHSPPTAQPAGARTLLVDNQPTACVTLATTPAQQRRGLQRAHPAPDTGMAFAFPHRSTPPFWMRGTPVALVVVWVDGTTIIGHDLMAPNTDTYHRPPGPITLAVELRPDDFRGGSTARLAGTC